MSRSSAVRDCIIEELEERLPDYPVDRFILPSYERESLKDGPRIAVRNGGREILVDQGPDERTITIEIAVVGLTPEKQGQTIEEYRSEEVAACDTFDALMESVIALWSPNGPLVGRGHADHRVVGLTQSIQFNAEMLYSSGVYLSMITLSFYDCSDE